MVQGSDGGLSDAEQSSVDSELALLYRKLKGVSSSARARSQSVLRQTGRAFPHPQSIYLVTRLAAYDLADVKL